MSMATTAEITDCLDINYEGESGSGLHLASSISQKFAYYVDERVPSLTCYQKGDFGAATQIRILSSCLPVLLVDS